MRHAISMGAVVALLASITLVSSVAHAHPSVDEARHLYEEADFVGALDVCAAAESRDDLTVDDLAEMYSVRALVYLAMDNADAMRADLARIVAIAPGHALDRRAPPDVQRALAEARSASPGPIRLTAEAAPSPTGVTVRAGVTRDSQELVREVRVTGRARGSGAWQTASDAPLFIAGDESGIIEYYAEAIGPGGALLATVASRESPLSAGSHGGGTATDGAEASDGDDDGPSPWLFVGLGAALLVIGAAIVIIAVGSSGQPDTQPSPFRVEL